MKNGKTLLGIALIGGAGLMLLTPQGQKMLGSLSGAGGAAGEETAISGKEQEGYTITTIEEKPAPAPTFVFQTPDFKGIFRREKRKEYTPSELRLPESNGSRFKMSIAEARKYYVPKGSTAVKGWTQPKFKRVHYEPQTTTQKTIYSTLIAGQLRRWGLPSHRSKKVARRTSGLGHTGSYRGRSYGR